MKAMLTDENKKLVWSEVEKPFVKPEEMLIEVYAAGVNRADILQRQGKYPSPEGCPSWMGLEISGTIVSLGEIAKQESTWKVGDCVCALLGGGGYAQFVSVRYDMALPIPKGFTMEQAAGLPEVCATAYLNLFVEGQLQKGQTVFIPAGNSGLSGCAIPMAKAFGARVITSVRSEESERQIAEYGADVVINTEKRKVEQVLAQEEKNGTPVNLAMDCLCGDTLGKSLPYMAHGGCWIVISTLAGDETNIPLRAVMKKGLRIVGSTLRSRTPAQKAKILAELKKNVWSKLESGEITLHFNGVFPIEKAREAHSVLERGGNVGKLVLRIK